MRRAPSARRQRPLRGQRCHHFPPSFWTNLGSHMTNMTITKLLQMWILLNLREPTYGLKTLILTMQAVTWITILFFTNLLSIFQCLMFCFWENEMNQFFKFDSITSYWDEIHVRWSSSLLSGPKNNALGVKIFISMSSTCVVQLYKFLDKWQFQSFLYFVVTKPIWILKKYLM